MSSTPTALARARWKLGVRATPFVFAFYMAAIMALLMCLVITGANTGLAAGYLWRVLDDYRIAMPTAFCCVLEMPQKYWKNLPIGRATGGLDRASAALSRAACGCRQRPGLPTQAGAAAQHRAMPVCDRRHGWPQ